MIRELLGDFDEVVVVVGSAQEAFTCRNPFTAGERIEMIARALGRERLWIIPVPDLRMPPAWTAYVLSLAPRVDVVAAGNPEVLLPFAWLGLRTMRVELREPDKYNGTKIRELMAGGGEWRPLVPAEVARFLDEIDGVRRVREVCSRGAGPGD